MVTNREGGSLQKIGEAYQVLWEPNGNRLAYIDANDYRIVRIVSFNGDTYTIKTIIEDNNAIEGITWRPDLNAIRNPDFAKLVATRESVVEWFGQDRKMKIRNTNRLLRSGFEGVDGIQTGSTLKAGNCLIASATRGNCQLIAVILQSRNRYLDATRMLEYGFEIIKK